MPIRLSAKERGEEVEVESGEAIRALSATGKTTVALLAQ